MINDDTDRRRRNRQVVEEFLARLTAMDIEGFLALWWDDAVQEMPYAPEGFPARLEGKAALRQQYGGLPAAFTRMAYPDLTIYETTNPDELRTFTIGPR